jgi:hypothetical protein
MSIRLGLPAPRQTYRLCEIGRKDAIVRSSQRYSEKLRARSFEEKFDTAVIEFHGRFLL